MENKKFVINDQNGVSYIANIITCFNVQENLYCLYSIPQDNQNHNIYIAKIIENNLIKITEEEEIKQVNNIVKKLMLEDNI